MIRYLIFLSQFLVLLSSAAVAVENEDDVYWCDKFPVRGTNHVVYALEQDQNQNLFAGGTFTAVGDIMANYVAKWNGSTWSALEQGVNGAVYAIACSGSNVYVGGDFSQAGTVSAGRIAKWNGGSWEPLGTGLSSTVRALCFIGNDLYAGGDFGVRKWDGVSWSDLGAGIAGQVHALAARGGDLYAGGKFLQAGGTPALNIAKWDGSSWTPLGPGLGPQGVTVYALAITDTKLYAGGSFYKAGTQPTNERLWGVAMWDGAVWAPMGNGVENARAIAVSGGTVYVGGNKAENLHNASFFKWNGTAWEGEKITELNSIIFALSPSSDSVYVGGAFNEQGGTKFIGIGKYSGNAWSAMWPENAMMPDKNLVLSVGKEVYVGSYDSQAPLTKWNGLSWSSVGFDGLPGPATFFPRGVSDGSKLYMEIHGGYQGTIWTYEIVGTYDGSWTPYHTYPLTDPGTLGIFDNELYMRGGTGLLKRYSDGWIAVYSDIRYGALFSLGQSMYCRYTEDNIHTKIASWTGSGWTLLGGAFDTYLNDLAQDGQALYAVGSFKNVGGTSVENIARWDGKIWSSVGGGTNNRVACAEGNTQGLFVAGNFTQAGGVSANKVAYWDGMSWSPLGSGIAASQRDSELPVSISLVGRAAFFAGKFTIVGNKPSSGFALWQPRVNISEATLSPTSTNVTIGNDRYGFYKPSLVMNNGTEVKSPTGLPIAVKMDQANEIHLYGRRVNNAFTFSPSIGFSGNPATLRIEFSEDDVRRSGKKYTDFRAVTLTYPTTYPADKTAIAISPLATQYQATPVRKENNRQIYSITCFIYSAGGTYAAVPIVPSSVADWPNY